ncbi:hypothetical protein BG011_003105 [Mortierella polycephala]|uniref:Serine aminopeptidase S33 domain-containing protein n=1 Tax=Mortierella polycephala TaxID=41804 RepID=A0A9P6U3C6_9FUNG|nr:hypothetical protein BG011_003105 [Mortierella polycephala]
MLAMRYQPLFAFFAGKGIEVQSFDLPGFGETGARADAHGITGGYDVLIKEIDSAIGRASIIHPTKPLFLMGHGMGGALVLNYVCGLGQRIASLAGIISSSPYLKPTMVGAGTRFPRTYNRLGKWYPNISVGFQVSPEELTRDCAEHERHHGDGLIRDTVSLQCLGDMIYQGQKILAKRWRRFPAPLPTLLLHGTDDPISSYQATSTLSVLLLKLQPTNFMFKSWKGNKHDLHWDIDAASVRSEYIHWIWNSSRHFVKLPLEPDMAQSDKNKSVKSKKFGMADKKDKKAGKKGDKTDQNGSREQESRNDAAHMESTASSSSKDLSTQPVNSSGTEPEVIQDLAQLQRQQELRAQRAMEKRQEYNLSKTGQESVSAIAVCPSEEPAPTEATIASTSSVSEPRNLSETEQRVEPASLNILVLNAAGGSLEDLTGAVPIDANGILTASSIVPIETQSEHQWTDTNERVDSTIIPELESNSTEDSKIDIIDGGSPQYAEPQAKNDCTESASEIVVASSTSIISNPGTDQVENEDGAAPAEFNENTIKDCTKEIGINLTTELIDTMPAIEI